MSSSTAQELLRRTGGRPRVARSMIAALLAEARAAQVAAGHVGTEDRWPSARYRADPVAFFREVLGVEPWARQVDIIEAVRDHPRVAVASGHKVSKSHTAAGAALHFYCSYDDARVVMSSTTSRQVDQILWRELRMMRARAKVHIDGEMHELARSGFKAPDFREVVGFTAREAEAVAGISGKNLLYILDEASGIDDAIFEAIEGNRAGGARVLMFSNPTRTEGEFFEAFHGKKDFYRCIRISSEESPNVVQGREIVPGLATREWVEEKKREWGVDSPMYKVRVKGEFVMRETAKVISLHMITEAQNRWVAIDDDVPDAANDRLFVGLDPAGESGAGDETAYAVRRGQKVLAVYAMRGLTADAHLAHLLGILRKYRKARDATPVVVLDAEGGVGASVLGTLRGYAERRPDDFELVAVRSGQRADGANPRRAHDLVRDKLWFVLFTWMHEGGAIPEDAKLAKELHAPEWRRDTRGRDKVTSKDELRKMLGRSPDRADALALSVWETPETRREVDDYGGDVPAALDDDEGVPVLDPYKGLAAWSE